MKNNELEHFETLCEQELIEAAKSNPQAMCALYRRHYATVMRYVSFRVATAHDVNDIVSEVFLIMVRDLGRFRWTGAPFQCWLIRIATSQIQRWVRKRKVLRFWAPFDDQRICASGEPRESEQVYWLRKSLLELPCRYQDVLALHYLEEMSIHSIAQTLDVREGTIKSRLSRGREMLRAKLEAYQLEEHKHEPRSVGTMLERTQA